MKGTSKRLRRKTRVDIKNYKYELPRGTFATWIIFLFPSKYICTTWGWYSAIGPRVLSVPTRRYNETNLMPTVGFADLVVMFRNKESKSK